MSVHKMSITRDFASVLLFLFLYTFQGFCFGMTQTVFLFLKKSGFDYGDIAILSG